MGLFGKKNKDNEDIEAASPEQDLDALVMSAIEQADEEEETNSRGFAKPTPPPAKEVNSSE